MSEPLAPGLFRSSDPALMFRAEQWPCPTCEAKRGERCVSVRPDITESGHVVAFIGSVHAERVEQQCPACGADMLRVHPCPTCRVVVSSHSAVLIRDGRALCERCLGDTSPAPVGATYRQCECPTAERGRVR